MHLNSCECEMQMNMLKLQLLRYVCVCVQVYILHIVHIYLHSPIYISSAKQQANGWSWDGESKQHAEKQRSAKSEPLSSLDEWRTSASGGENWQVFWWYLFWRKWQLRFLHIWFLGLPKPLILPLDFEWRFNRVTLIPDLVFRVFGGLPPKTQRWKTWFFTRALEHRSF